MINFEATTEINQREAEEQIRIAAKQVLIRQGTDIARDIADSLIRRSRRSRPGETPSLWSDKLKDIVVYYDDSNHAVLIFPRPNGSSNVPEELEFGSNRIQARPYLRPAFERNITRIVNGWKNAIK